MILDYFPKTWESEISAYQANKEYAEDDYVVYQGNVYKSLARQSGTSINDTTKWEIVDLDITNGTPITPKRMNDIEESLGKISESKVDLSPSNLDGILSYANGGTNASTLDNAKANLGVTALENRFLTFTLNGKGQTNDRLRIKFSNIMSGLISVYGSGNDELNALAYVTFVNSASATRKCFLYKIVDNFGTKLADAKVRPTIVTETSQTWDLTLANDHANSKRIGIMIFAGSVTAELYSSST